jgi:hypothetical protein
MSTMTAAQIADHNRMLAELTADDCIPRLTWEQHTDAFKAPVTPEYTKGALVAAWDSATPGTVNALRDDRYEVTFPDLNATCSYAARSLRPWPLPQG